LIPFNIPQKIDPYHVKAGRNFIYNLLKPLVPELKKWRKSLEIFAKVISIKRKTRGKSKSCFELL
jgi:hypothetical protein